MSSVWYWDLGAMWYFPVYRPPFAFSRNWSISSLGMTKPMFSASDRRLKTTPTILPSTTAGPPLLPWLTAALT